MRRLFFVIPGMLISAPAFAQQTDEQLWLQTNAAVKLGKSTSLTLESIARFSDNAGGFFHYELGGIVSFKVARNVEIGGGYRHVQDYDHGVPKPNEERLREQVIFTLGHGFTTKLRLEQRFSSAGGAVGVRLRPQVRFSVPLKASKLALFASHEDFINLNTTSWGQLAGYERMRNAVGVTVPLTPKVKVDIGYLNQYRFGHGIARDQMDHAATLSLALTL